VTRGHMWLLASHSQPTTQTMRGQWV